MIDVMEDKDIYLASFDQLEKLPGGQGPPWLHKLRRSAMERFVELGFPTLRDEEWRFTNVAPLVKVSFKLAPRQRNTLTSEQVRHFVGGDTDCYRLVFVNGHFAEDLSSGGRTEGMASLATVLDAHPSWPEPYLARFAKYDEQPFTALNTAFIRDGACVLIPKGAVIEKPIHLVYISTARGEPVVSHPRNLIMAFPNSQATIIESYIGLDETVYFTNAVTEIILDENAFIDHYKLQQESTQAFHIATQQVRMERTSNFSSHSIALGGGLVRNDVNAVLAAEGSECTLNGLYLAGGRQLIDNHTRIDHAKPHCASHELYKGILDGKARGVFNGKIYVHQDAQKTDAKQTNKTLLLSEDAMINTKPQLEIFADDVKCTHGATVGQLAGDAIFYLRARGIGLAEARKILTFAFANDIVSRIKIASIREQLEAALVSPNFPPRLGLAPEAP
jgi:Fe-S cluster assembly protein SufD